MREREERDRFAYHASLLSFSDRIQNAPFGDARDGGFFNFAYSTVALLVFPLRLFIIVLQFFKNLFFLLIAFVWNAFSWFKLFPILLAAWFFGYVMFFHYGLVISQIEHFNRCILYDEQWDYWDRDFTETLRDIYDRAICWTNALGFLNRLINVSLLIRTFRECDVDPPFKILDWLKITADIVVDFISDTLRWSFSDNLLNSAYPAYTLFENISTKFVPYTARGFYCLCKDARILFDWTARILNSRELDCIGHQLANAIIGTFQTVVNFILDVLRLILAVLFSGSPLSDIRDMLLGVIPGDVVMPNLSKVNIHERTNSAGVLLGEFLNNVFTISYCTVTAEIDSMGNSSAIEPLYQNCTAQPKNRPQLFCIVGIIVSAFDRLLRMQGTLLWHVPQILYETATQPPGPRYLTESWYAIQWNNFFDTLRDPLPLRNYTLSLNFPTIIPGTNVSSIIWPNDYLYGPPVKPDCHLLNNSRFGVPCQQCPEVSEVAGEICVCQTADFLDSLTQPIVNITFWRPWVCCAVARAVRAGVAVGKFLVGVVVYIINIDRLGRFLADQNHYDIFFDEVAGTPYVVGGFLQCLRDIVLGFDHRMRCFIDLFVKPAKSVIEGFRTFAIAVVRLINNVVGTSEPGFEDYVCVTNATNCMDLERVLSHLRRPRVHVGYDPTFGRVNITTMVEPAFIDCVCYWFNFQVLIDFLTSPPPKLPDFCCALNYAFRMFIVEGIKIIVEAVLASIEMLITIFDPSRPFTVTIVEWAACINTASCSNAGDIISDAEDLLNCPCNFLFEVEDILGPPKKFFCICDILAAAVQTIINLLRSATLFFSDIWDMLYCISHAWVAPHCTVSLHNRLTKGFQYLNAAGDAFAGTVGGIGCILGLPWIGLKIDCLGTTFTWPFDYPPCQSSQNVFGPGQYPCTMSDRLSRVFFYLFKVLVTIVKFVWLRIEAIIDIGFAIFTGPTVEHSISQAIVDFFLELGDPFFGTTNKNLTYTFDNATFFPWPNTTGLNLTALAQIQVNTTNSTLGNWTYQPPPSQTVYGKTFNYSTIAGLNETTGLIQAIGLTINCLLGLPAGTCPGPMLFAPSSITGTDGCLGDIMIAAANAIRDLYVVVIEFIGNGLKVLEFLFTNPSMLGDAIIAFIRSFFKIIFILVKNAQIVVDAIINVIVEVARFIFGDGVAEMFKFFLTVISKVITVFIDVIEFLMSPFIHKRFEVHVPWTSIPLFKENSDRYPESLEEAFKQGYGVYVEGANEKKKRAGESDLDSDFEELQNSTKGWRNTTYWKAFFGAGGKIDRKRNAEQTPDPSAGPPPQTWTRVSMADFGPEQIQIMTPGFCKRALSQLDSLSRFDGMDLSQELIWKGCFYLFSLPNEIYAYSNGTMALPPDAFYDPSAFGTMVLGAISTMQEYLSYRSQSQGSSGAGGGTYTEIFQVPDSILQFAEQQATLHDMMTALTVDDVSTPGTPVTQTIDPEGTFLENFVAQDSAAAPPVSATDTGSPPTGLGSEFSPPTTGTRKRVGDARNSTRTYFRGALLRFRKVPVSYVHADDPLTESENDKHLYGGREDSCAVSFDKGGEDLQNRAFRYCVDDRSYVGGFVLEVGYPPVSDLAERDAFLKDLASMPGSAFRWTEGDSSTRKRGLVDASTGSSVDTNLIYNKLTYDNPSSRKFNPFFGTHIKIYTSLSGRLLLNISKYGIPTPVIDGKIALTHQGMNFVDYMMARGLDSDLNLALVSSYEDQELTGLKESYLRLNAKSLYLNHLYTKNYTQVVGDPDNLSSGRLTGGDESFFNLQETASSKRGFSFDENVSDKKETNKVLFQNFMGWLQKLNNVITSSLKSSFEELSERGSKPSIPEETAVPPSTRIYRSVQNGMREVRESYHRPVVAFKFTGYHDDFRNLEGAPFDVANFTAAFRKRGADLVLEEPSAYASLLQVKKESLMKRYISEKNAAYREAKAKMSDSQTSWLNSYLFERFPGAALHVVKALSSVRSSKASTEKSMSSLKPSDFGYLYDPETGGSKKGTAAEVLGWMGTEAFDTSTGRTYGPEDEVFVLFSERGRYSLYSEVALSERPSTAEEKEETRAYAFPSDVLFRPSKGARRWNPDSTTALEGVGRSPDAELFDARHVDVEVGYYEHHYGSPEISKRCLREFMWPVETHVSGGRSFTVLKCYKKKGLSSDHPHQEKYGETLRGRTIFQYWFDTLFKVKETVSAELAEKLDVGRVERKFKEIYLQPWIDKYRDTIRVHGKVPTLNGLMVVYESIRKSLVASGSRDYAIPDRFLEELGHYPKPGESEKRNHFPPLIDICLPKNNSNPASNETNCQNCTGCSVQDCHYCGLCYNCTLGFGGFYDCQECGACKVGPTSHCKGGCFQCTGCQAESSCLDCLLVQELVSGAIDIVDYCYQKKILNNSAVDLVPLPNTTLYPVVHFNASEPAPNISSYGFSGFFFYLNDIFWYGLAKVTGYKINDMIFLFFSTTNTDPFNGSVGFLYILRYNVPWPFLSRCNRDIHTACTFGLGLRTALIVVSVLFLVAFVLIYLNFGVLGTLMGLAGGSVPLYFLMVASLAWHWNSSCLAEPFFSVFSTFGLSLLAFPILPQCAMDEIFDLLNSTITRCSTWFPAALTTDGITCPVSCNDYVNITNCSALGFYSLPTTIGYAGQRWIPKPQNFWLNDYLNRTCLVKGMCPFGFGWAEGALHPFFEHNYNLSFADANTTATLDACFHVTIWGVLSTIFYVLLVVAGLFLAFEVLALLWNSLLAIFRLPPLGWMVPPSGQPPPPELA